MEFSRQEYWSGLPFPPPGESSRPRDRKTQVSYVVGRFFTIWATRENKLCLGTSLAVQWLRLRTPTAGATGSIPGLGNKNPHATERSKKKKKKKTIHWEVCGKRDTLQSGSVIGIISMQGNLATSSKMTNACILWLRRFTFKNLHPRFTGMWVCTELFIVIRDLKGPKCPSGGDS